MRPGPEDIDLIPPLGAVLVGPDLPGPGVDRQPLNVPVAVGKNFPQGPGAAREGVVPGDAPV